MTSKDKPIYGLVLAGGKSKRMGHDKGLIQWHSKPQRFYMADLLKSLCQDVFISCRADQVPEMDGYKTITDNENCSGPIAGIISAFQYNSSVAWLVIACDLPLLDAMTVDYLISHRDTGFIATTFISPHDGLPEPLISIWEPTSFPVISEASAQGINCPRKTLINAGELVKLLQPPISEALLNTNTAEDADKVRSILQKKAYQDG